MMRRDRTILILGSVAAILALVAGGLWLSRGPEDAFAACRSPIAASQMRGLGAPFNLTDQNGRRVGDGRVLAGPALLYFGYSYCPDICPIDAARNAEAADILDETGIEVTPVFVSVDPGRDTPEILRAFAEALHPRMIALTGTAAEIAAVAKAWQIEYRPGPPDAAGNYTVDHMTNSYLVMPGAGTVASFARDLSAPDLAARIACFAKSAKRPWI